MLSPHHHIKQCARCNRKRWVWVTGGKSLKNGQQSTYWKCSQGHKWTTYRLSVAGFNKVLKKHYLKPLREMFSRPSILFQAVFQ